MTPVIRFLVHFTFFYTCIEGLVVNILFPARLPFIYKDLVLLVVYLGFILPDLRRTSNPSPLARTLNAALLFFIGLVAMYLLVPTPVSLLSELVAVKQRVFYIPLVVVAYFFVRSIDDVRWLVITLAAYSIAAAGFGIYLFFSGPEGLRGLGAGYSAVIYAAQTSVETWRVPGTFTSPGQFGVYLMFNGLAVSALLLDREAPRWSRILALISLLMITLAMAASGTRSTLVLMTGGIALALLMSGRLGRTVGWVVGFYAMITYAFATLGPGVRDRLGSIASVEHIERFRTTYFGQLFARPLLEQPLGVGLGVATIGARHFSELGQVVLMESYFGIIAVEMGWPGLIAFLAVAAAIVGFVIRYRTIMAGSPEANYWIFLAAFVLIIVAILPVNTSIDSAPGNFYFWFSVGVLVRLVELQYWRQWAAGQPAEPETTGGTSVPAATA
jgi:hypothetical protein